jgi:hypothetical protein
MFGPSARYDFVHFQSPFESEQCVRGSVATRWPSSRVAPENHIEADETPDGPEIVDRRASDGCWNNMTFCFWHRGVELLIDTYTLALNNQVRIFANLLCDVGVRYPAAIAVTAAVT